MYNILKSQKKLLLLFLIFFSIRQHFHSENMNSTLCIRFKLLMVFPMFYLNGNILIRFPFVSLQAISRGFHVLNKNRWKWWCGFVLSLIFFFFEKEANIKRNIKLRLLVDNYRFNAFIIVSSNAKQIQLQLFIHHYFALISYNYYCHISIVYSNAVTTTTNIIYTYFPHLFGLQ